MKPNLIFLSVIIFLVLSCQINKNGNDVNSVATDSSTMNNQTLDTGKVVRDAKYFKSKGFQVFQEYNLAIKCPLKLEDVSNQVKAHHDFCYGCIDSNNSQDIFAMYQVMINDIPAGYKNSSDKEKLKVKEAFYNTFSGNKEKVKFENIEAVVVKYRSNGYEGRSLIFINNDRTYVFNMLGNDNIEKRFNTLTNNIILLDNNSN